MNLIEEFPKKAEMMEENPIDLYKIAQQEAVPMNKFGIWVDARIREKYNLPKTDTQNKIKIPNLALKLKEIKFKEKAKHAGEKMKEAG